MKKIRSIFKWFVLCFVVYLLGAFLLDAFDVYFHFSLGATGTIGLLIAVITMFLYFTIEGK